MDTEHTQARLRQHLDFIRQVNPLKDVLRRSLMPDSQRRENSAEHSWHVALMADVLSEHAHESVNIARVTKMLLIHDIVEVDAGDTYLYDLVAAVDQEAREQKAAERLFGLLPSDQSAAFRALWDEFEARETADAKFAKALDRFQPLYLNYFGGGIAWQRHGITRDQVLQANAIIADGSPSLWQEAQTIVASAVSKGWLT